MPIKLGQSSFDFSQKYEPFNGIVDGGIWGHRLESLDNAVAGEILKLLIFKDLGLPEDFVYVQIVGRLGLF